MANEIYVVVYDNGETYEAHHNHNIGVCLDEESAHYAGLRYVGDVAGGWKFRGHYYIEVWEVGGDNTRTIRARKLKAWKRDTADGVEFCATDVGSFDKMRDFAKATGWTETEVEYIPTYANNYATPFATLYTWTNDD